MTNLIITNPEIFYKKETQNIILGEWCYLNDLFLDKYKNAKLFDFYHWDNLEKKKSDFEYLLNLSDKTISFFQEELNKHFKLNY